MKPVNVFEPETWTRPFKGKAVVYRLFWAGKPYIGSSINLASRLSWWRKSLPPDATMEVLIVCEPSERHEHEQKYINLYDTVRNGYNKTFDGKAGGIPGRVVSDETREKIRSRRIGFKFTDAAKEQMSESAKLRGPHSKEIYSKISAANTGKKRSSETKQLLSDAAKGKPKSEAHRAALKAAWVTRRAEREKNQREVTLWAFGAQIGAAK